MATMSDPRTRLTNGDRKLSTLVSGATQDLSALMREEVALAKAEVKYDVKQAAAGGGLFGAAGLLGFFALIMLSFSAAAGIHAAGLGIAWAFLIVAGAYLVIAGLCAMVGKPRIARIRNANATKRSATESLAMLKRVNH
jgi:predicted phage tail protein